VPIREAISRHWVYHEIERVRTGVKHSSWLGSSKRSAQNWFYLLEGKTFDEDREPRPVWPDICFVGTT
jgi:hypothetical protein